MIILHLDLPLLCYNSFCRNLIGCLIFPCLSEVVPLSNQWLIHVDVVLDLNWTFSLWISFLLPFHLQSELVKCGFKRCFNFFNIARIWRVVLGHLLLDLLIIKVDICWGNCRKLSCYLRSKWYCFSFSDHFLRGLLRREIHIDIYRASGMTVECHEYVFVLCKLPSFLTWTEHKSFLLYKV